MKKPPFAMRRHQLRAIQEKYLDNDEVMTLLREIKRLQRTVLICAELMPRWGDVDSETLLRVERAQCILDVEPCIAEHQFEQHERSVDDIANKRNTRQRGPSYADGSLVEKP